MIVISGALVLVALVLLVLGLTLQDLTFVYGSIGVSLVSFVFLVIGILQRRGEELPAAGLGTPAVVEDTPGAAGRTPTPALVMPAARQEDGRGRSPAALGQEQGGPEPRSGGPAGPVVLVVPGRPRFHVAGCRYLSGRPVEQVDLEQARARYTACGVCRPEENLPAPGQSGSGPGAEVIDSGVPGAEHADGELEAGLEAGPVSPPARPRAGVRAARTKATAAAPPVVAASGTRRTRAAAVEPARAADTGTPPRPAGAAGPARGRVGSTRAATAAPATAAPATAAPATVSAGPAAAPDRTPARRGRVVVIPERGRYHTAQCRFVRDALGTEELTRAQAHKQGYQACGVCKP